MKVKSVEFQVNGLKLLFIVVISAALFGCQTLAQRSSSGVIVARRAQIRSSTAVVAADLLQVNRGDQVEILDSIDVQDPNDNSRMERWLRVRAADEDATEGWIEARNVMPEDVLASSKKLAAEDNKVPPQASGQLRASSNLRLTPDRSGNENIMMRLDSGSSFDIVGWKRVPKPKSSEAIESDVAPKAGSAQQGRSKGLLLNNEENNEPEETNELWYKVRLSSAISPAPAGWIYGKQVELTVPSDIIFYRTGREFVAWQRLDNEPKDTNAGEKDAAKEVRPGSWLILEKSNSNQPHLLEEPDFDRIYVLGYDKRNQEHYTAYRSPDLKGFLPARVEGQGESKAFTLRVQDGETTREVQYTLFKDVRGVLKVNPPSVIPRDKRHK